MNRGWHYCKKILFFAAKLLLAGAIVWYLLLRDPDELLHSLSHLRPLYLIPALITYGLHLVVCSWRWRRLALILKVALGRFESFSLTMQGIFFSLVIPGGAIGGDVVKLGVISRRSPEGSKMEGAFTVVMDRIIGMIALFGLVLVLLPFALTQLLQVSIPHLIENDAARIWGIVLLALLCLFGLFASGVIFFHRTLQKLPLFGWAMTWGDRVTHGLVGRMTSATDIYARSWKELGVLVLASVFGVHLMTVVPMFFLLSALGADYSFFAVILAISIGNVIGLIPIFPSGVGGRDLTAVTLLVASGIAPETAKSAQLIYTAIILLFSLSGGIFFAADPGRSERQLNSEASLCPNHGN